MFCSTYVHAVLGSLDDEAQRSAIALFECIGVVLGSRVGSGPSYDALLL